MLTEMAYPVTFSFDEFNRIKSFNGKLKYANDRLKKLSSGSARVVYQIDNEKVLKIAKNKKGIAQNTIESDYGLQQMYDIVARVYEIDDNDNFWLEMELAKKLSPSRFKSIVGLSIDDVEHFLKLYRFTHDPLKYFDSVQNKTYQAYELEFNKLTEDHPFLAELEMMIGNYDFVTGDFGKISSYGEVERDGVPTVVLIDFGLTSNVWEDFYKVNLR